MQSMTQEQVAQIAAFINEQRIASMAPKKLNGLIPQHMIRGVDPNYQYQFREYPKALTPPSEIVDGPDQERRFRARYRMPLPFDGDDAHIKAADYYAIEIYPKRMTPPQVVVHSIQEEEAQLAAWEAVMPNRPDRVAYPRWMFHAEKEPRLVSNIDQETALGVGWYPTIAEAIHAASHAVKADKGPSHDERDILMAELESLGAKIDRRWSADRMRAELDNARRTAEIEQDDAA